MVDPVHEFHLLAELKQIASVVLFGGFVLALAGEMILPRQVDERPNRRLGHGLHNLLLWIAGIAVMSFVFGSSVWLVLRWLQLHGIGVLYLLPLPPWLLAALAFILLDACDYFFHRLSHNTRWLWLMHAVHHSDTQVDVTTNLRQHPLHIVCTELWKLVACAAIGVPTWVFLIHEILVIGFAHLHHVAIRWPRWIDRVFAPLLVTPRMHWNHHSPDAVQTNSNYGSILSIWDRAFGTLTRPNEKLPPRFGLTALAAKGWHSVWGMLATPWRARTLPQF